MPVADKMRVFAEKSSWIRKMFEQGAAMKAQYGADKVYDFSIGNPDAPPPPKFTSVIEKIVQKEDPGVHGYMPNAGYPWVREALAQRMSREQEVQLDKDDILMACGAAGGLNVVMKAILNPGDEVIILAPYFVEYGFYIDNHGGIAKVVQTDEDCNLDLEAIEKAIGKRTRAIFINSPNNPSGQIYPAETLKELGRCLDKAQKQYKTKIYLVSDEPYRKIVFDNHTVPSIFKSYLNSIVVSSYSKDLSLPGERIGYLAVHPEMEQKQQLLDALVLATRILGFLNAPALMQRVVAELQNETVNKAWYADKKERICPILRKAGLEFQEPKGGFYVFPKAPIEDDVKFTALLQQEKILVVPGSGFGRPGYIRVAFCVPIQTIKDSEESWLRATGPLL
ncbi:MAG: aspartate aminotransferase [Deltaproteobacteria bacterium]|nr:MAG: aspartate aminotransferase [Deltaproteobacteria bacterium]